MAFLKGENRVLFIKKDGVYFPIGCLTSNSFSETASTIGTTTRDTVDGWSSSRAVRQGYSISFAAIMTDGTDAASVITFEEIKALKRSRMIIEWKIASTELDPSAEEGIGVITALSEGADAGDGFVTFDGSIEGLGLPLDASLPPVITKKWIEIDDAWVYKGVNSSIIAIEVGDMIRRYSSPTKYIHGRVDSLPYTDDSNLTIFEEIILI